MATLARGGRLNFFGFVLRLAGAACRSCSSPAGSTAPQHLAASLMRCWSVEFAAQLAALGLRRGLAQLLANAEKPQSCIVADALLVAAIGSAIGMAILIAFPKAMYPDDDGSRHGPAAGDHGAGDQPGPTSRWQRSPIAMTSCRRCARARSSSRGRSASSPSLWSYVSLDDGLIVSYVFSRVAALIAALIPLVRSYGLPHGWKPDLGTAWGTARRNMPRRRRRRRRVGVAAHRHRRARRCSCPRAFVGIYYVAQQVATLPAKLKTSFEPILGPVIARKIAAGDRAAVAKQVRQVELLDHRRPARHRACARYPRTRGHGPRRDRASPAVLRCSPSCSPPR